MQCMENGHATCILAVYCVNEFISKIFLFSMLVSVVCVEHCINQGSLGGVAEVLVTVMPANMI